MILGLVKFKYQDNISILMEINKTILVSVYILIGFYIVYKLFFKKNPYQEQYEKLYNEILTSDKNKVKGQYDKEEQWCEKNFNTSY